MLRQHIGSKAIEVAGVKRPRHPVVAGGGADYIPLLRVLALTGYGAPAQLISISLCMFWNRHFVDVLDSGGIPFRDAFRPLSAYKRNPKTSQKRRLMLIFGPYLRGWIINQAFP